MNQYNTHGNNGGPAQEKGNNAGAASAAVIGSSFHNPYTFIPFPDKSNAAERNEPLPLTMDEFVAEKRISGVLALEVKTLSPVLCQESVPYKEETGHRYYHPLSIGNDVILPATSVRGSLRTLMTILSGGTLGYMDTSIFLCQGRDAHLGADTTHRERQVFIGEVVEPGNSQRAGKICIGETRLVYESALRTIPGCNIDNYRPKDQKIQFIWIDSPETPSSFATVQDARHSWKVKLCGRPVNTKGKKKEGAFKPSDTIIDIPVDLWADYQGRNRHGARPELKRGDLVWLEPRDKEAASIQTAQAIESLQWARWGKHGVALRKILPKHVRPDSMRTDGEVDMVTELFGQVPMEGKSDAAGPFAARIRPHNLVFGDGMQALETAVSLAPLSSPHPGCLGFYRDEDPDKISQESPLKGYKVYRNTSESGVNAPWKYDVQGVYETNGRLKLPQQQRVNKTVDLLKEGQKGSLRISFRSLSEEELALLLTACSVDWKLGGGKPLGLGHCRVTALKVISETGELLHTLTRNSEEVMELPENLREHVAHIEDRVKLYHASQKPVDKLRYPRAAKSNANDARLEGLQWFSRHASPRKAQREGEGSVGMQTLWTRAALQQAANGKTQIKAQCLPKLNAEDPSKDLLFGYDSYPTPAEITKEGNNRTLIGKFEVFEQLKHGGTGTRGENTSLSHETRQEVRNERSAEAPRMGVVKMTKESAGEIIAKELCDEKLPKEHYSHRITELSGLGITAETSNKWEKKITALRTKAGL